MALNKNSTTYVIGFVFVITVICALIIASAATFLKPAQVLQKEANIQKNVLKVANIDYENKNLISVFKENIQLAYVDLKTGNPLFEKDLPFKPFEYDQILLSSKYKKYRTTLESSDNYPGLKDNLVSNYQKVYLVKDKDSYSKVILPFYGNGLWSVMYGLLAVDIDGNTVKGITYYQQGETPGLGGEVENPNFTNQFIDKVIYKEENGSLSEKPSLQLSKSPQGNSQVNALTGATLTSNGVNNQLSFWLGKNGYESFLRNLQKCHADLFINKKCAKEGGK